MFSIGQIYFAIFFIIAFTAILIWMYRKDLKLHKLHYKNAYVVLIAAIAVIILFTIITFSLH